MHTYHTYSYINDGKTEIQESNMEVRNGTNKAVSSEKSHLDLENNNRNEMFYKDLEYNNSKKSILGKSVNEGDWKIEKRLNNRLYSNNSEKYYNMSYLTNKETSKYKLDKFFIPVTLPDITQKHWTHSSPINPIQDNIVETYKETLNNKLIPNKYDPWLNSHPDSYFKQCLTKDFSDPFFNSE